VAALHALHTTVGSVLLASPPPPPPYASTRVVLQLLRALIKRETWYTHCCLCVAFDFLFMQKYTSLELLSCWPTAR
jgi:hypothetical protein